MATVKHLSYAGITIPLITPQMEEWVNYYHSQVNFEDFSAWNFDQPGLQQLPTPSIPTPPELKCGTLFWPTGVTRPAWFHFITTTERLNLIKSTQGATNSAQSLLMYDGRTGKTVTAQMYMLPERPLNQLGHASSDAWIVTLTDARWYWHWRRGIITQPSSWNNLFQQIASILGISITVDTVDPRYATPSSKWTLPYRGGTSVILDAAAAAVGQRVVVGLDGSVRTVNWETARLAASTYTTANAHVVSGGLIDELGIARYVPSAIRTLFLDATEPTSPNPHVETKTLASLAISQYGSSTGVSEYYQTLNADINYTGANATEVSNYAVAASEDWYGWRLSDLDLVYPGIEPWVMTGWEDSVEWTIQKRETEPYASTLVRRGPWNDFQSGDWYVENQGSGSGCLNPLVPLTVSCEGGTRTGTVTTFSIAEVNGKPKLQECGTEDVDLGVCSELGPVSTPITTGVCPVFTTICYTDCNGDPQTLRVVTDITVRKVFATLDSVEGVSSCETSPEDCGSGGGSGGCGGNPICDPLPDCFPACEQCPNGMSSRWTFAFGELEVQLCNLTNPTDGNQCRFLSSDLNWEMKYDAANGVWSLVNKITGATYFILASEFSCTNANTFEGSSGNITINPEASCGSCEPAGCGTELTLGVPVSGSTTSTCLNYGFAVPENGNYKVTVTNTSGTANTGLYHNAVCNDIGTAIFPANPLNIASGDSGCLSLNGQIKCTKLYFCVRRVGGSGLIGFNIVVEAGSC